MRSIWKDRMIIHVYELSKSGMSEAAMSKVLGVSLATFRLWETNKKLFRMGVKYGRKALKGKGVSAITFQDYVYRRMKPELRAVWDKIKAFEKEKKGFKKIEALLEAQGKYVRQHLFVHAWTISNFNTAKALRTVNISRSTFDFWRKTDKGFAQIVKEIDIYKKDFFENHLIKLVRGGSETATLFVNKTYNQDRYPDPKKQVDVNLSGQVTVSTINLGDLELPLKLRKGLLKAIRKYYKKLSEEAPTDES